MVIKKDKLYYISPVNDIRIIICSKFSKGHKRIWTGAKYEMNSIGKIISVKVLNIFLLMSVHIYGKLCSNSSDKCQEVRLPLVSNKLNAPLIAELNITSMNKELKTYIQDDIKSTFSKNIHRMVKNEQDDLKVSMLQDYSSKNEYDTDRI